MRICFVAHQATKEGAGLFMLDQIDYLQKHGESVCAVLPGEGMLATALDERRVDRRIVPSRWWTKPRWVDSDADHAVTLRAARQMADLFRDWSVDVVYTETAVAPAGPLGAVLAGLPHIWHVHEFCYNPGAIELALPRSDVARLFDLTSNFVFFNSKAVAAEWEGLVPRDKT